MDYNSDSDSMKLKINDKQSSLKKSSPITLKPKIDMDFSLSQKHQKITIKNIDIFFPFVPYDNQITYMSQVIDGLNNRKLCALESPTGTGKTLCLLCACLAWVNHERIVNKNNNIQIFYTSRTHSQLSNVIKELKKTCYLPSTAILSSRDNLCVNPELINFINNKGNLLNIKCKIIKKRCSYFKNNNNVMSSEYNLFDIEDLSNIAKNVKFCPFFFEREKMKKSDIVFMPYNYIFEGEIRKALDIDLKNAIIVIDEAHNVQSVCENASSCSLSEKTIDEMIVDLKDVWKLISDNDGIESTLKRDSALRMIKPKDVSYEIQVLDRIRNYMKSIYVNQGEVWPQKGKILTIEDLFTLFFEGSKPEKSNQTQIDFGFKLITPSNSKNLNCLSPANLKDHLTMLSKIEEAITQEFEKTSQLSELIKAFELLIELSELKTSSKNFTFFLSDNEDSPIDEGKKMYLPQIKKVRTLNIYCFNAGFGFSKVLSFNPHSVILTSGTLSPISGLASELKCTFPVSLENKHVVQPSQVHFAVLTGGKVQFKFDSANRNNSSMVTELGETILKLIQSVPGGVLVFFPSYSFMNQCHSVWTSNGTLRRFSNIKEVFKDQKDALKNKILLKDFVKANTNINKKRINGGLLFSVCRGSSSEGMDFTDDIARMVIIVGVPFANLGQDRVKLKKEFLDKYKYEIGETRLTGSEWYMQDAIRAVNQGLGRVIRHVNDYGAMIALDVRYKEMLSKKLFSGWLRESAIVSEANEQYFTKVKNFFTVTKKMIETRKEEEKIIAKIDLCPEEEEDHFMEDNEEKEKNEDVDDLLAAYGFIDTKMVSLERNKKKDQYKINRDKHFKLTNDIRINNQLNDKMNSQTINKKDYLQKKRDIKFNLIKSDSEDEVEIIEEKSMINRKMNIKPSTSINNSILNNLSCFPSKKKINQKPTKSISEIPDLSQKSITTFFENKTSSQKKPSIPIDLSSNNVQSNNNHISINENEDENKEILSKLENLKNKANINSLLQKYQQQISSLDSQSPSKIMDDDTRCPICYTNIRENPNAKFSITKCHHIMCDDCWDNWLKNKLECPICKKKVRKQTLSSYIKK